MGTKRDQQNRIVGLRPATTPSLSQLTQPTSSPLEPEDFLVTIGEDLSFDVPGYIYVAQWGADGPVKIGQALSPRSRIYELQIANWMELHLVGAIPADKPLQALETRAHHLAANYRIRGEWFDLHPLEAIGCVIAAAKDLGRILLTRAQIEEARRRMIDDRAQQAEIDRVKRLRRSLGMD